MWADNEANVDLLNVQHLVGAVLRVVKDDRLDPVTIGVYGDWGSGKSSVIQLLRQRIAEDEDLMCVYFNGWRFEGYDDAKAALATTILENIKTEAENEAGKLTRVKASVLEAVKNFWGRIDKLRLGKHVFTIGANTGIATIGALAVGAGAGPLTATALLAVLVTSLAKEGRQIDAKALAELVKEREAAEAKEQRDLHVSIRDFHKQFAELVSKLGVKRLVVVVDDLDRCLPNNVIETLEAIRLFLAVPNTSFVIAADEAQIREAVATRFPELATIVGGDVRLRASVSARYLEKLIQVPIRVPPLSRSDVHGYLNLLFAEKRSKDAETFKALCARVMEVSAYDAIAFHAANAEALMGEKLSDDLRSDFVLAEQIAPALALCSEGNPRQTKRFLNALVLRIEMAEDRGVTLDRSIAAKLLLLEYFLPEMFRTLALEAAANEGRSATLAALESEIGGDSTSAADKRDSARSLPIPSTFATQADTMLANERFATWVRAEPLLGAVDIRPYIYFASERYALPVGVAHRLSVAGARALEELQSDSEAAHQAGADAVAGLPLPEVAAIISELTTQARSSGVDLQGRASPLQAMIEVAKKRPELGPDVIAAILGMPYEMLPASIAVALNSLWAHRELQTPVTGALRTLTNQNKNKPLKVAAEGRLAANRRPTRER